MECVLFENSFVVIVFYMHVPRVLGFGVHNLLIYGHSLQASALMCAAGAITQHVGMARISATKAAAATSTFGICGKVLLLLETLALPE